VSFGQERFPKSAPQHAPTVTKQFKKAQIVKHIKKIQVHSCAFEDEKPLGNKLYILWLFGISMTRRW
jgi:hypothetical protein